MVTATFYLPLKSNLDEGLKKYSINKVDCISYKFPPVFHSF